VLEDLLALCIVHLISFHLQMLDIFFNFVSFVQVTLGGEGRAGKTSVQDNLLGKGFNKATPSTNGINITAAVMSDKVCHKCMCDYLCDVWLWSLPARATTLQLRDKPCPLQHVMCLNLESHHDSRSTCL
jgi:hypothetical protein